MPISSSAFSADKRKEYRIRGKTASVNVDIYDKEETHKNFLTIGPAVPSPITVLNEPRKVLKRSLSTLSSFSTCANYDDDSHFPTIPVTIQNFPDGSVHVSRTQKAKEKNPDRICLDRRGLSAVPVVDGEAHLRLLSLQHNLLSKLDGLEEQGFSFLVFLDVYDNQLDKISSLDTLENLRVLLMGKNRVRKIEGLSKTIKLEVLDLHGNQISQVNGLTKLSELKVLNLAGNQIRIIGVSDLRGLSSLQELNLRRNKIKKLLGFGETVQLQKLFLSNNEIQNVTDMSSVAKAVNLREVAIDSNPVSLGGECVSFLVSYLPQLNILSNMQITEQVRKAAMIWRKNKESTNAAFMDLTSDICLNVHREEIISNARTNWELLRSQTKCITATKPSTAILKDMKIESDFILTPINKPEIKAPILQRKIIDKRVVGNSKMSILPDKKINMIRTSSQDTENSQNTSSSNASNYNNAETFRLPPILVPLINKIENCKENGLNKKWGSLSSLGPNVDSSSFASSNSPSSSDSEIEKLPNEDPKLSNLPENKEIISSEEKAIQLPDKPPLSTSATTDTSSVISSTSASIVTVHSSTSGSELSNTASYQSAGSKASSRRNIKSATSIRNSNAKLPGRAVTAKAKPKVVSPVAPPPVPPPPPVKDREQGGDYLIEICGRYLNVYGQGALRFIEKSWNVNKANDVTIVKFSYVNFNNIVGYLNKIKTKFSNVETLIFCETNISFIGQLNGLAEVQGFSCLKIEEEGNPIYKKKWRSYAVYRLSHWGLKNINDVEITNEELQAANEEYQSLSDLVLYSLPDVLLQPLLNRLHLGSEEIINNAKSWLYNADSALKNVVCKEALQWRRGSVSQEDLMWRQKAKVHIGNMIETTCETVEKLRLLENEWPQILNEILKEILSDYSHLELYMKRKFNELK